MASSVSYFLLHWLAIHSGFSKGRKINWSSMIGPLENSPIDSYTAGFYLGLSASQITKVFIVICIEYGQQTDDWHLLEYGLHGKRDDKQDINN